MPYTIDGRSVPEVDKAETESGFIEPIKMSRNRALGQSSDRVSEARVEFGAGVLPVNIFGSAVSEFFASFMFYLDDQLDYNPENFHGIWKHLHLLKVILMYGNPFRWKS